MVCVWLSVVGDDDDVFIHPTTTALILIAGLYYIPTTTLLGGPISFMDPGSPRTIGPIIITGGSCTYHRER